MDNAARCPQGPYFGDDNGSLRRIEEDWLGGPEVLALKLDSHTDNTSLALAFELTPGGKVLLFPGDAQVGNWLSWHDYVWPAGADPADPATVTARQLLARTVFYKVGHHGSHNATLREMGLELMTHQELVAAVPVDERYAAETQGWREIPFDPLLEALREKTRGRMLRADQAPSELRGTPQVLGPWSAEEWHDFLYGRTDTSNDALWVEHRIDY